MEVNNLIIYTWRVGDIYYQTLAIILIILSVEVRGLAKGLRLSCVKPVFPFSTLVVKMAPFLCVWHNTFVQ